jgi:putative hydrolase of the HAD superfamily
MKAKNLAIEGAAEAMVDAGIKMPVETIISKVEDLYRKYGWEDQRIFERFLKKEYGSVDYEVLGCAIAEYKKRKTGLIVTYPMVRKTLIELIRMGMKLGLLSDAPRIPLYTRVAELKLNKYFNNIVSSEDVDGKRKPDPAPFLKICEVMKLKPKQCVMVGDWEERDMVGAKNVGMTTVYAAYGSEWDVEKSVADFTLNNNIHEIINIIKKLNKRK